MVRVFFGENALARGAWESLVYLIALDRGGRKLQTRPLNGELGWFEVPGVRRAPDWGLLVAIKLSELGRTVRQRTGILGWERHG